jgi:hypothetical protein
MHSTSASMSASASMDASWVMTSTARCETHQQRLVLLDPQQLGDRPEAGTVIDHHLAIARDHAAATDTDLIAFNDAPEMARHPIHLLRHGLLHLGRALGRDLLGGAPYRVVGS